MARKSGFINVLFAAASFAGGLTLGLLLAPKSGKENRRWVSDQANEMTGWMDEQGKQVLRKGSSHLKDLRKNVRSGIQQNVPDLYKATEHIELDGTDLMNG